MSVPLADLTAAFRGKDLRDLFGFWVTNTNPCSVPKTHVQSPKEAWSCFLLFLRSGLGQLLPGAPALAELGGLL